MFKDTSKGNWCLLFKPRKMSTKEKLRRLFLAEERVRDMFPSHLPIQKIVDNMEKEPSWNPYSETLAGLQVEGTFQDLEKKKCKRCKNRK